MTPEQIASDLVRAVLRATNSTDAEAACRAALRERDAAWAAAVACAGIRRNEFGGIAVPTGGVRFENGADLRALLEEAGK